MYEYAKKTRARKGYGGRRASKRGNSRTEQPAVVLRYI
jgi:hypothetical protein